MSHQTDEEQIELLKRMWKDYGQPILVAVAITLVGVSGYKYWQKTQYETAAAASVLYQNLLDTVSTSQGQSLTDEQKATVNHVVDSLQTDYESSRYAAFATLYKTQILVQDNKLEEARQSLEWVLEQDSGVEVMNLSRVRLARVLLSESGDNGQKALDLLMQVKPDQSYQTSAESVKGDAYMALGQVEKARESYQKALDAAQSNQETRPVLQLKLDDLAAMAPIEG